jgi:hypothetical protein
MLLQPLDCFLMSWFLSRGFRLFTSALVNSETTPSRSASKGGRASRSTISAKEAMRPSLISSFDPSPGALAMAVRRASGSRVALHLGHE